MKLLISISMCLLFFSLGCTQEEPLKAAEERAPLRPLRTNGWESNDPQDVLLRSIVRGDIDKFESALRDGAQPDHAYVDDDGQVITPILVAASYAQKEIFLRLLKDGVNPFVSYNGIPLRELARYAFGNGTPTFLKLIDAEQKLSKTIQNK